MSTNPSMSELQMIRDQPIYCPMTVIALILVGALVLLGVAFWIAIEVGARGH